jgi:hypothetical protein
MTLSLNSNAAVGLLLRIKPIDERIGIGVGVTPIGMRRLLGQAGRFGAVVN